MSYIENLNQWKEYKNLDSSLKKELEGLTDKELEDAFYMDLEFGTGGLRGVLGVGTNRMNIYTVRRATKAFGTYLLSKENARERGVCISHDNRHMSREFAITSAKVLTKLGFKVYLFEDLRPTPELSFSVRRKHAIAGIMITASHNPKEYNGYKIYDEFGCQLLPEEANKVIDEIAKIKDIFSVDESADMNNIEILGHEMDLEYVNNIKTICLNPNLPKDFKVTYTPLHGTGQVFFPNVLKELGYDINPVMCQMTKDPDFSGVKTSNPENKEAYDESIEYAKEIGASLCLATDPDADRLGVAVLHNGQYILLTGNQSATVIFNYIVNEHLKRHEDLANDYLFTTVVSGRLCTLIAQKHGIKVETTLTGFKYIGDKARQIEGKGHYLFGYEESYGCLIKDSVRDKDSLQACIMLCEAAAYYYTQGMDLYDVLLDIYKEYGYTIEDISNIGLKGIEGKKKINQIMDYFRNNSINLSGYDILVKEDMKLGTITNLKTNEVSKNPLPSSNVIKYHLDNDCWFVLRPSGTEPKLKVYYGITGSSEEDANAKLLSLKEQVLAIINNI